MRKAEKSYFGDRRKGKRGRGAAGKLPAFGLLKRGGRVYTLPIPNAKAKTLMPILESRVVPDGVVYTDSFAGYDVLDVSRFHHRRIDHGKTFADREENKRHINGTIKLLKSGKTTSTQIQRHSAQAFFTTSSRNANGASMEETTKSFTASCYAGLGGRGCLSRPAAY